MNTPTHHPADISRWRPWFAVERHQAWFVEEEFPEHPSGRRLICRCSEEDARMIVTMRTSMIQWYRLMELT